MASNRNQIALLFKQVSQAYTADMEKEGRRFPIQEKQLQKLFSAELHSRNIPHEREITYSGNGRMRVDFRVYGASAMEVELEWEAKQTDGFAKRTFEDLRKLDHLQPGEWGMFLALNIGNKYARVDEEQIYRSPASFSISPSGRKTYLTGEWERSQTGDLLRCNPKFWRWSHNADHCATVLSCYGLKTAAGGWVSAG